MTKDEKKYIAEIINSKNTPMSDMIFKAFSTISLFLITWTLTNVNANGKDIADIKKDQQYTSEKVDEIKNNVEDFTSKPRFTSENFENRIEPLYNEVKQNRAELNVRSIRFEKIEENEQELKLQIKLIQNKISQLEEKINKSLD